MKTHRVLGALACALLLAAPAAAQAPLVTIDKPMNGGIAQGSGVELVTPPADPTSTTKGKVVGPGNPLPTSDASYQGEAALAVGTPVTTAGRSLKANCTATGSVTVTYADSSTGSWVVTAVGTYVWPIAVLEVNSATAACTYANLK